MLSVSTGTGSIYIFEAGRRAGRDVGMEGWRRRRKGGKGGKGREGKERTKLARLAQSISLPSSPSSPSPLSISLAKPNPKPLVYTNLPTHPSQSQPSNLNLSFQPSDPSDHPRSLTSFLSSSHDCSKNPNTPLDCWREAEDFKAAVAKLEQVKSFFFRFSPTLVPSESVEEERSEADFFLWFFGWCSTSFLLCVSKERDPKGSWLSLGNGSARIEEWIEDWRSRRDGLV